MKTQYTTKYIVYATFFSSFVYQVNQSQNLFSVFFNHTAHSSSPLEFEQIQKLKIQNLPKSSDQ